MHLTIVCENVSPALWTQSKRGYRAFNLRTRIDVVYGANKYPISSLRSKRFQSSYYCAIVEEKAKEMEDGTRAATLATQATRLAFFWCAKHESAGDESVGLSSSLVSYAAVVTQRLRTIPICKEENVTLQQSSCDVNRWDVCTLFSCDISMLL